MLIVCKWYNVGVVLYFNKETFFLVLIVTKLMARGLICELACRKGNLCSHIATLRNPFVYANPILG